MATITVARHELSVSARETVIEAMCRFDPRPAVRWGDLLYSLARHDRAVYITAPDRVLRPREVAPHAVPPADVLEMPWRAQPDEAVSCLAQAGYLSGESALLRRDDAHNTYLDTGRFFEAVTVLKPFMAVTVTYGNDVVVADEIQIRAGTYITGSTGLVRRTVHRIGYMNGYPVDPRGFGVSRVRAECGTCCGRWRAKDGSWWFRPERARDTPWTYTDAHGHRGGTIACPTPQCAGRVGFLIF
ncbi:hypothetical protein N0X72_12015 [Streptomyces carpaticus]|uniref:hypothetical protein n=1 Tax=Streptomyces carpaticus TaxID=285558 RepID=UPI002203BD22|nr:hypothetical protein N0X72_12015 [Streptomyces carpaticus]